MPDKLAVDLQDLEVDLLETAEDATGASLESLLGGHALAEVAASGQPTCSCCIACCCC